MDSRPDLQVVRDGDSLGFEADLPAFATIGAHYGEVEDARLDFAYSREYIDGWIEYVDAVQKATAEALAGRRPWAEIVAELSARYPEEFPRSLDRVPTRMLSTRQTPEGHEVYLEWLAQNARIALNAKMLFAPGDLKTGPGHSAHTENLRRKRSERLPPGRYRFDLGDRDEPTENQKQLFDQIESDQAAYFQKVADALRAFYRKQAAQVDRNDHYEQVLFPLDDSGNIPLDRFRVQSFLLHESDDRIGLCFDSLLDWCEEHGGLAILIESGEIGEHGVGNWEVLQVFYES